MTLNSQMPASLNNARFIINPPQFIVGTEIDIYKNIGVFVRDGYGVEREIPGTRSDIPSYSIDRNTLNQRILTIFDNVNAGDVILIKTFGLNHRRSKDRVFTWSESALLKTGLPPPINLDDVSIKPVVLPLVSVGPDNAVFADGYFATTFSSGLTYLVDNSGNYLQDDSGNFIVDGDIVGIGLTQPSSSLEGRILEIRVTGDNVNFSPPAIVTINGISNIGVNETILFTSPGKKLTTYKWKSISSIYVQVVPINSSNDSFALEIKEAYSITEPAGNNIYPVIRFAYRTQSGTSLKRR